MNSYSCLPMSLGEDNSEKVKYTVPNLSIRSVVSTQSDYPQLSVVNHWHNEFEFSLVTKGHMMYSVNGKRIELNEGDLLFVNSRRMHYGFWEQKEECEFLCTIFGLQQMNTIPTILMKQIIHDEAPPYIKFCSADLADRKIIDKIYLLHKVCQEMSPGFELFAVGLCHEICGFIYERCNNSNNYTEHNKKRLAAMHSMIGYIQKNYTEKISLDDIASAGSVCRSRCCELFKEYIGKTPFDYLNEYRISKSIELLKDRNIGMTEIAARCGFNSSSYFTEVFHKIIGCSPTQFTK